MSARLSGLGLTPYKSLGIDAIRGSDGSVMLVKDFAVDSGTADNKI